MIKVLIIAIIYICILPISSVSASESIVVQSETVTQSVTESNEEVITATIEAPKEEISQVEEYRNIDLFICFILSMLVGIIASFGLFRE